MAKQEKAKRGAEEEDGGEEEEEEEEEEEGGGGQRNKIKLKDRMNIRLSLTINRY